ncbi:hypothetical protein IFM89_006658 [Coptis chinensis]|uniref:Uncharacterized protein n=1 Tax=Coptis chinensis TaxID=261450 RepID=A0A835IUN0_9MAGN|nr:hypothetical protein IFM89_006658 [Coptis chinensis]
MDPQTTRVGLHPAEGDQGEHHEKKSVMNRVKARAMKIKDTLVTKTHGYGQGHDQHENDDDHELDGEVENDYEKLVQDPEVHGAPIHESVPAKNGTTEHDEHPKQSGVKSPSGEDFGASKQRHQEPGNYQTSVPNLGAVHESVPARNGTNEHDEHPKQPGVNKSPFGEDFGAPKQRHQEPANDQTSVPSLGAVHESVPARNVTNEHDEHPKQSGVNKSPLGEDFGAPKQQQSGVDKSPLGEDFGAPKQQHQEPANYQTSVPSLGAVHESVPARNVTNEHDEHPKQSGVNKSPLGEDFGAPKQQQSGVDKSPLGEDFGAPKQQHQEPANYQTSVPSLGAVHESVPARNVTNEQDDHPKQSGVNKSPLGEDFGAPKQRHQEPANDQTSVPSSGAETGSHDQFSSTPSADFSSDKTNTTAENTIPVPKGYDASESDENRLENMNGDQPENMNMNVDQPNQGGYTDKMPSVNSAIADKALLAKNVVASKIGYGDKTDDKTAGAQTDRGENVPSAESVEEPTTQQSSYTEKISSAAVSAKNMAASKLGYGGSPDSASSTGAELNKGGENAPVYGKEAGVGSAVISKIPGIGMITQKNTDEGIGADTDMGTGSQVDTGRGVGETDEGIGADTDMGTGSQVDKGRGVGETDKGVASVKGYIAEKLKPGEEDKALSEVISGAFHKPKVVVDSDEKKAMGQGVSDAFHKRNSEEEMDRENKPMGKVTESEKVADRLGSSESEKGGHVSGNDSPGKGVVDKFKGAFTSWFGKGGETNPSQAFNDTNTSQGATGDQGISGAEQNVGENRLQEGPMGDQGIPGAEQNVGQKRLQESIN